MISYASFSQNPSPDDSAKIKQLVADLVVPFEIDSVPANFVLKNGSTIEYNDQYQTKSQFNNPHIDTIIAMGKRKSIIWPLCRPRHKKLCHCQGGGCKNVTR